MKPHIFLISLLLIMIAFGLILPNGLRAAVANNAWSIAFVREAAQAESINPQDFAPPPTHRHAGMLLANQAYQQNQTDLAESYMTPLMNNPDRLVLNTYANILFRQGDHETAITIWKDLGLWATLQYAAAELRMEGNFDQAVFASRSGYELFPEKSARNLVTNLLLRANNLVKQNQYPEAIIEYQAIVDQFPNDDRPYMLLAQAYWQNDQPELAFLIIEQGWDLNTTNHYYYASAADIYEQAGFLDEALRAYQKALKINPNNSSAQQGLERLLDASE